MANEKRLIDANDALEIINHEADVCNSGFTRTVLGFVAVRIENIPTVDAVEVVRCKDCKYRTSSEFCECRPAVFFCAEGERKDNERKADRVVR